MTRPSASVGQRSKIRPDQIEILCSSLRISGHLPAPIVNGAGDRVGKVQFSELQKLHDLDIGTIVHHLSTSIYIPNFIEIGKTFCGRTYGRTYLLTDIFPPLMLLG